ncbi:MAG TPA: cytidine deaminase [Candidatus Sumerlaeota bacterium]|nr:MAG: Cytidine deaminase [candidate division BRC1 bacterium ADurb.Bin183]HOE64559.1 cytidine deaminase [Candidatus Sumerlaeota bacterium]HRR31222.1 cytidine deaminase [Candidatus Sumerlaeia bacterium]HON49675.1 cytidine deaminase [Candidatus Sumerlaeota bacterium]HOR64078.1 cytidine deaminase [Candidatus Sumerlaeota bacterium]
MENISDAKIEELAAAARAVREHAYAPYSQFKVGSALLSGSGAIYTGCNVENASYGLTVCAERNAIFAAVAAGEREIKAIAIVTQSPEPAAPCGACRQVLIEFAADIPVILENTDGIRRIQSLNALFPMRFNLPKDEET